MSVGTLIGAVTRNLAPYFNEAKGARASKNWLAFVGRGGGEIAYNDDVNEVKYDITRGSRLTAKLVKRSEVVSRLLGDNQKNVGLGEYTEVARAFPLSMETYDIQASKLRDKLPGEPTENSGRTSQYRMTYWAAKGQTELMSQQIRLANYLCGQGILEGVQDAVLGTTDTDLQYDFYRKATHAKTLSVPWLSNLATATPLVDFDEGCDACIEDSGAMPEFALMGSTAISAMFRTTEFTNFADNRGFQAFRSVGGDTKCPENFKFLTDNGWECRGFVTTWEGRTLWLFGTEELLELTPGTTIKSMPAVKVVLGNTTSRHDAQYGPTETFPDDVTTLTNYQSWFGFMPGVTPKGEPKLTSGIVSPRMFSLDAYKNKYNTNVTIRSQMAPLFIPVATDEWYVMENAGE